MVRSHFSHYVYSKLKGLSEIIIRQNILRIGQGITSWIFAAYLAKTMYNSGINRHQSYSKCQIFLALSHII